MVQLIPVGKIKVINGLHCVVKEKGKQRLIFDGRPVNHVLAVPDKVTLPDFSLLENWEALENSKVRFGKLDLDNFYHRLGVPQWLIPYLGLPPLRAEELGLEGGMLSPACLTLPMGLAHSVLLAQLAHLQVLSKISVASLINTKVRKDAPYWIILYIDDVIVAGKGSNEQGVEREINSILQECISAYAQAGLVINVNKMEWATTEIMGLGCVLSEKEGGILPKMERLTQVVSATHYMLSLPLLSGKSVEFLLGHWIWFILLYRPLYSICFHVYRWLRQGGEYERRRVWQSVKREFQLLIVLADLCKLSWRRTTAPTILAMDASLWGAGACESKQDVGLSQDLIPKGTSLKLAGPWGDKLSESTIRRLTIGLAPSTITSYASAIAKFKDDVEEVRFNDLDSQLLDHVQSFPLLSQRAAGEKLSCAFRHFFPEISTSLPRLNRFLHQLRRKYKGISKPPMIWDVVVLLVFQLVRMGFPVTALGVLLQFDCFLRLLELAQIRIRHIAFPGGRFLGSQAQRVLLLLPRAKTGPLQSVRVQSKLVIKLLTKAAKKNSSDTELFPSVSVYRQRMAKAMQYLGLSHIGYTPHSIRHGAATMALINEGEQALPAIMFRGRWESSAGRSYLQMGAAALLYAEIPETLIKQAEERMDELPKLFKHLEWIPKL